MARLAAADAIDALTLFPEGGLRISRARPSDNGPDSFPRSASQVPTKNLTQADPAPTKHFRPPRTSIVSAVQLCGRCFPPVGLDRFMDRPSHWSRQHNTIED
ncbi:hypothetical protein CMUS01_07457 [Colletotrichum musicola]|uniref:Uncharacterized protein n=1 Tax=Colletotrichum musicola TaxID=2175873 RepID=A0A8H6KI25_9PEZI|nr:hypothetical protein CMUS01_07457 [Colletotrichum musicola]